MMQLGFVSAILPECTLAEVLQTAAAENYSCVEVMCWPPGKADRRYAGVTHLDVTDLTAARITEVHKLTAESGVQISAFGYYPNPLCPDRDAGRKQAEHIKSVIRAAGQLGLHNVNSFVGRDWTKSVADNWPLFREIWPDIIKCADDNSVRIGIENCPMFFTADEWPGGKNLAISPTIWRQMFAEIPSPNFGLNFDPSHCIWQQMDYLTPLREFADRLFHIHAKDARLDRHRLNAVGILGHPNEYHTPKLPGMGDVNWGQFFSVLGDVGYKGAVCVEVEDRVYESSLENRKLSLRQSARFLRQFVPN